MARIRGTVKHWPECVISRFSDGAISTTAGDRVAILFCIRCHHWFLHPTSTFWCRHFPRVALGRFVALGTLMYMMDGRDTFTDTHGRLAPQTQVFVTEFLYHEVHAESCLLFALHAEAIVSSESKPGQYSKVKSRVYGNAEKGDGKGATQAQRIACVLGILDRAISIVCLLPC